ncbi:MAG: DUF4870 domain-containing protein [Flavobacterium sp.]|nr:DUF4870 domain-containing protein [Flavobacterium sp.]
MYTTNEKNTATYIHLSSLSQYLVPFGNLIFPLLIWNSKKENSDFIDYNGKQVLNFQLSILIYTIIVAIIALPIILINVFNTIPLETINCTNGFEIEKIPRFLLFAFIGIISVGCLKITEFFLIIYASLKSSNGEKYNYPLTITFIK